MSDEDEHRSAILARRARYIAMALAGVSTATTACTSACLAVPDAHLAAPDVAVPDAGNVDADH